MVLECQITYFRGCNDAVVFISTNNANTIFYCSLLFLLLQAPNSQPIEFTKCRENDAPEEQSRKPLTTPKNRSSAMETSLKIAPRKSRNGNVDAPKGAAARAKEVVPPPGWTNKRPWS